jgi:hypothetical protein
VGCTVFARKPPLSEGSRVSGAPGGTVIVFFKHFVSTAFEILGLTSLELISTWVLTFFE